MSRKWDKVVADSKSKGAGSFVQGNGDPGEIGVGEAETYLNADDGFENLEDEQWVYLEEGDLDKAPRKDVSFGKAREGAHPGKTISGTRGRCIASS